MSDNEPVWHNPWTCNYGAGIRGTVTRSENDRRYYWDVRAGAANGSHAGNEATSEAAVAACNDAAAHYIRLARGAVAALLVTGKVLRAAREAHDEVVAAFDKAWHAHRDDADRTSRSDYDARPGHENYCPLYAAFVAANDARQQSEHNLQKAERAVIAASLVEPV